MCSLRSLKNVDLSMLDIFCAASLKDTKIENRDVICNAQKYC
jgi:hypothetical protein